MPNLKQLTSAAENVPPEPAITPHEANMIFTLMCGNDEYSALFYRDIILYRGAHL